MFAAFAVGTVSLPIHGPALNQTGEVVFVAQTIRACESVRHDQAFWRDVSSARMSNITTVAVVSPNSATNAFQSTNDNL